MGITLGVNGAPDRIRTCDPQIRNLVLYPTELRALARGRILPKNVTKTHCLFLVCVNPNCDSLTSLDFIKLNGRYADQYWNITSGNCLDPLGGI